MGFYDTKIRSGIVQQLRRKFDMRVLWMLGDRLNTEWVVKLFVRQCPGGTIIAMHVIARRV
jgi:hypothetical protein